MKVLIDWQHCMECGELWMMRTPEPVHYKTYAYELALQNLAYVLHKNEHTMSKLDIVIKEGSCKSISHGLGN